MPFTVLLLLAITLQRLGELAIAARNTRTLLAGGAYEAGRAQYPVMVAFHAAWLITLWIFGWNQPLQFGFVAALLLLQAARFWVIATLGNRWTTRIIVVPGAPLVTSGPFRFVRHPNYLVVALELPLVSLALGLPWHALLFGIANLGVLAQRVRTEDDALRAPRPARGGR